jgi:hypothetical protein
MHSGILNLHAYPHSTRERHSDRHRPVAAAPKTSTPAVVDDDAEPEIIELVRAGEVLVGLAERHSRTKDNGLAEVCYLRALDIFSKALPSNHPKTASTRDNLAMLYRQRGRMSVAENLQRTAVEDLRKHYGDCPHASVARSLRNLAETCLLSGKVQEGLKILAEALQVTRQLSSDQSDHVVEIHKYHAQVMARLG